MAEVRANRRAGRRESLVDRLRSWAPVVVLWVAGGVAVCGFALAAEKSERQAVAASAPEAVAVGSRLDDGARAVVVDVDRAPDFAVRAPVGGRLTSLNISVGDPVRNGEVIARIDGSPVVAFRSQHVPYRDLARGDRGVDVEAVSSFFADIGMLGREHVSDRFGSPLERAVRAHQRALGVTVDGIFRPSSVAFVSQEATTVGQLTKEVGEHVVTGDPLFDLAGRALSVDVRPARDGDSLAALRGAAITFVAGTASLDLAGLPVAADEIGLVEAFVVDQIERGVLVATDDEASSYSGGSMRLAEARVWGTVPTRALFGSRSGSVCVFVMPEGIGGEPQAHALPDAPAAVGEIGTTLVPDELIGAQVIRDPHRLAPEIRATCG